MYEKISHSLSSADAERWRDIESKKQKLVESMALFPLSTEQFEQKASAYTDTIVTLREELHRASLQTKGLLEQVQVLELLLEREDEDSRAVRSIKKEREYGEEFLRKLEKSQLDVEEEKNRLLLRGDLLSKTIILRREYLKLLHQESDVLRNYLHGMGSGAQSISRLESDITGLLEKTDSFSRKLNGMVRRTLYNVREIYETERRKIEHYQSQIKELLSSVDDLARLALFSNINKVKQTFNGIVLQADQGVINVAWERKDGVSRELLKYRTEKAKEIQRLNLNLEGLE
jgi:DNA-dependent RNA polymerase auxiliary subunit epsilon